jgi:tRNA(fMet)-specific endonuclease VapC
MIYLLDTDTLIALIRGLKPDARPSKRRAQAQKLRERCRRARQEGHAVGLSAITVAELEFGARHGGRYVDEIAAVHKILAPFQLFAFDPRRGPWHYGKIRHELEECGKTIGAMDLLIAAHALSLNATLVTNNREQFERVTGLRIANWL